MEEQEEVKQETIEETEALQEPEVKAEDPQQEVVEEKQETVEDKKESAPSEEEIKLRAYEKYLNKTSTKKKITLFSILGVCLVLSVVIITLACIQLNYLPKFVLEKPATIDVETTSGSRTLKEGDEEYEKFLKNFEHGFDASLLTSIFMGHGTKYVIKEDYSKQFFEDREKVLGENYARLVYGAPRAVETANGREWISERAPSSPVFKFTEVFFSLEDKNGFNDVTLYIPIYGSTDTSSVVAKIKVIGNTQKLIEMFN